MPVDNVCKQLAEASPASVAAWLLDLSVATVGPVEVLNTELSADPIRPDFVALVRDLGRLLHVEFQFSVPSSTAPPLGLRMAEYALWLHRRHRLPVDQVLVLLNPELARTSSLYRVGHTRHAFRILRLWEEDPAPLLADPALLPLAVLARTDDRTALLSSVAQRVRTIEPPERQTEIATIVQVLAGVAINWEVIRTMFGDNLLKESSVYQHFVAEGQIEEARLSLISFLESRFGAVPADVLTTLDRCPLETLRQLMPIAATCPSITAFAESAADLAPPV